MNFNSLILNFFKGHKILYFSLSNNKDSPFRFKSRTSLTIKEESLQLQKKAKY